MRAKPRARVALRRLLDKNFAVHAGRAVVIQFPGSNAALDATLALETMGFDCATVFHKASSFAKDAGDRRPPDLVVIPGGFAFGDYLRAGALVRVSPIIPALLRHVHGGGYVLGICNGFQILTELGLLPGALLLNETPRFLCRDAALRVEGEGAFTRGLVGETLVLPVAHARGRYECADHTLSRLNATGRVALRYESKVNGSRERIAGVYSENGRVLGLMPHPERATRVPPGVPADCASSRPDGARIFSAFLRELGAAAKDGSAFQSSLQADALCAVPSDAQGSATEAPR